MQERLIFVISPPRAGSTLMQRMLGAHAGIFTHPEPHLITPIAHLGIYGNVDKAPYDHINAAEAMRAFVDALPNQEADYLDALRCYTDTLYGRMLSTGQGELFLDKTPAYALVLPFLQKLYPEAKYILLTRHPLGVFSSYANSFFNGDWKRAHDFNPVLERYVPAMARFIRERPVPLCQVAYEDLVQDPVGQLERVFAFLGLENDPDAVNYGKAGPAKEGMGDPISVQQHDRPVVDYVDKWAAELHDDDGKLELAKEMIARIDPDDLATWGWPLDKLWLGLEEVGGAVPPKPVLNSYTFQRRVMLALKKDIDRRPHGKLVRKIRYYCDVLLRE